MDYLEKKEKIIEALKEAREDYSSFDFSIGRDTGGSISIKSEQSMECHIPIYFKEEYVNGTPAFVQTDQPCEGGGYFFAEGSCSITLRLDDSIYNTIYMFFDRLHSDSKRYEMLELLNDFNDEGEVFKFYISGNTIMAEAFYISSEFDAYQYLSLMKTVYQTIKDKGYYQEILELIWS